MIFTLDKLKGLIREKGLTQKEVAINTGMSPSEFSLKINGKKFFDQEDIQNLMLFLDISEYDYKIYFFTLKV